MSAQHRQAPVADTGGCAFPCVGIVERDERGNLHGPEISGPGMNLRDYFAAKAPPPPKWWLDCYAKKPESLDEYADVLVQWAYCYADRMLEARGVR